MADISDVTAYLASAATTAVYPNGTSQPSVASMDVRIFEGWPNADQLDLDISGKTLIGVTSGNVPIARANGPMANVSIFPMLGMTVTPFQVLDHTYTITSVTYGLSLQINGNTITFSGTPQANEYVSVVADRNFAYSATGASAAAIISALATAIAADYPGVSSTSSTLTVPVQFSLVVRQGGKGKVGRVIHRQKHSFMVTVWAPTPASRSAIASAIDIYIKNIIRIVLPDTSQAVLNYNRTNVLDDQQMATIYRRDLIYDIEYATIKQDDGFVVTAVSSTLDPGQQITTKT